MPKGKGKSSSKSPAPPRKSSRGAVAIPEPSPAKKTRSSVSQSPAPKSGGRKASPSPSPIARGKSRGRSVKAAKESATPEVVTPKSKSRAHQGEGDKADEAVKGRVTRAVVQETEVTSKSRGRSGSRATAKSTAAPERTSRSSSRNTVSNKPTSPVKTPKGKVTPAKKGKGGRSSRASEEVKDEEDEEEEVEEKPKATPKAKIRGKSANKATPKSQTKTTAAKKNTPKKSSPKKNVTPSPASRGRKAKTVGEESEQVANEPQVILEKIDSSKKRTPSRASPSPKSTRKRPTAKPSPRERAKRGKTSAQEEEEVEEAMETNTEAEKVETKDDTVKETEVENVEDTEHDEVEKVNEAEVDKDEEIVNEKMEEIEVEKDVDNKDESISQDTESKEETDMEKKSDDVEEDDTNMEESTKSSEEIPDDVTNENMKPQEENIQKPEELPMEEEEEASLEVKDDINDGSIVSNGEISGQISPKKRKFDEIGEAAEEHVTKKVRLSVEGTTSQENGAVVDSVADEVETKEREEQDEEYDIISMDEIPPADSKEVLESIPKQSIEKEEKSEQAVVVVEEGNAEVEPEEEVKEVENENEVQTEVEMESNVMAEPLIQDGLVEEQPIIENDYTEIVTEQAIEEEKPVSNNQEVQSQVASDVMDGSVTNSITENQMDQTEAAIPKSPVSVDWVLNRKFIHNPDFNADTSDSHKQFSVVSYNILAQCHLDRNDYSFTEDAYLSLEYRHEKLIKEMKYLDADIICMQEVGPAYFESTLLPAMRSLGYEGMMMKRTDDYYDEGEASFYRTTRFSPIQTQTYSLKQLAIEKELLGSGHEEALEETLGKYLDRPDVLVIMQLQCNNTGNIITVGNIHVHWGKMEVPDVQCVQIASAIKEVVSKAGSDGHPHILCGDFNSEVTSPGYQLCTEGYLSDDMIQQLQNMENLQLSDGTKTSLVNHLWRAFQHTSSGLKSAYYVAQKCEPKVTSYNRVMKAAVDYIFYSANCLSNLGVLEVPADTAICATGGIPDQIFPSDHVSVMSKFSFK